MEKGGNDEGKIFLVDDDELIVSMLTRMFKAEGYEVQSESSDFEGVPGRIEAFHPDIALLDINLLGASGVDILEEIKAKGVSAQVVMLTANDSVDIAVKCMKLGAADYLAKPFNLDEVRIVIRNLIEQERVKNEKTRLEHEVEHLRRLSCEYFDSEMLGASPAIKELRSKLEKIAEARVSSLLITGESGTGKEVAARSLHHFMFGDCQTHRDPFVGVNCAALPEHLLESELFGHEKGAFTDARLTKKGVFELANGGIILLDEIGDMKPELQSKLLRVLEERRVRRIGGREDIPFEVTVVATTNKNLSEAVKRGEFRSDLFFRLSTFYLHIPPLRERKEDIPVLARHFLRHFGSRYNKKTLKAFSPEAEEALRDYGWPGNARELKNLVERLVVLESAETILPSHLPNWLTGRPAAAPAADPADSAHFILPEEGISLEEVEKEFVIQALKRASNNKAVAAKLLNIGYDALRYQIKKFKLE